MFNTFHELTRASDMPAVNPVKVLFKDRDDFRSFHRNEERSFVVLAMLYIVAIAMLGLVYLVKDASWALAAPVYVFAYVVVGWVQYSIGNGLHEAVHHNLKNKKNDFWASLISAYPVGLTIAYRDIHLRHHRYLGTEKDPELDVYTHFPKSKIAEILRFVWYMSGIPALLQFAQQQKNASVSSGKIKWSEPIGLVGVQLFILALFWWVFGNPLYYFVFWVAPIATVGKLCATTRLLCEHGSPTRDWVVRTIDGNLMQRVALGAFDFSFHAEHHLFPSVPYAQLRKLYLVHREYADQHEDYQPFEGRLEFYSGGYLNLIAHWFKILPWRAPLAAEPALARPGL